MAWEDVTVLEECGSTNIEAADTVRYGHGAAVIAQRQTAGRGQRGHKWESAAGENLTFSIVFEPVFVPASEQFMLSEVSALAVTDTLAGYGIAARIKWTNDIYVGDSKICGILIEHSLSGGHLSRTISGIGVNVNQTDFPAWLPNPCSMATVTGSKYAVMEVFDALYANLRIRYGMLEAGKGDRLAADYHALLYRRGVPSRFFIPGRGEVIGVIRGAEADGRLKVTIDGQDEEFLFKEIEFII